MKLFKQIDEPIECMSTIGTNQDPLFTVVVNPDSNRSGDAYLKLCNGKNFLASTEVVRLSLKSLELIKPHHDGKKEWVINNKYIKKLKEFLSKPSRVSKGYSNWQYLIYSWNYEYGFLEGTTEGYDTLIDAFFDGYYDTEENLADPSYVPSYQQMPNWKL